MMNAWSMIRERQSSKTAKANYRACSCVVDVIQSQVKMTAQGFAGSKKTIPGHCLNQFKSVDLRRQLATLIGLACGLHTSSAVVCMWKESDVFDTCLMLCGIAVAAYAVWAAKQPMPTNPFYV